MQPIAITPGEPAGIGPDVVLELIQQNLSAPAVIIADPDLLAERAKLLKLNIQFHIYQSNKKPNQHTPGQLHILPIKTKTKPVPGVLDKNNAHYVLQTLETATQKCLSAEFSALVTGPVHKGIINDAGIPFSGHTEFLGSLTNGTPVMMLTNQDFRVALVTTHLALKDINKHITKDTVKQTLEILNHDLKTKFNIKKPRILVTGLNPHAGENGHLGDEEINIIQPVIEQLKQQGLLLTGPLPADTLFTPKNLENADAVLAMYHDQGLPVLKYAGFGNAINITLGLPIIRTSVDHGTALELAGSGKANYNSLHAAFELAAKISH